MPSRVKGGGPMTPALGPVYPQLRITMVQRRKGQVVPNSDIGAVLLDHLVGTGEQHRRHFEAERLGGWIDHQLESGRTFDRQIGGLGASENRSA